MIFDLIIVGGGSSGVFAYLTYKEKHPNKNVLIIEFCPTTVSKSVGLYFLYKAWYIIKPPHKYYTIQINIFFDF